MIEDGNPGGRPLLFIHGWSQCRLAWAGQLHSDLAEDFRLVADINGSSRNFQAAFGGFAKGRWGY